jgi:lysophospholipase L1-like esterase
MKTLLLSILLLTACGQGGGSGDGNGDASVTKRLFVFGDEISYGANIVKPWPAEVAKRAGYSLRNYATSYGPGVVNAMNNSLWPENFTSEWIGSGRFAKVNTSDIVIIFFGYNDARWSGSGINTANFDQFLLPVILGARTKGARVFVVGTIGMPTASYAMYSPLNNGSDAAMLTWNNAIKQYVQAFDSSIVFIDALHQFNAVDANFNGQWPNDAGQAELADIIATGMGL